MTARKYPRDWREPLDHSKPMAAARIVRRDRYAWPGHYALMLITTDGGALCPACVAAEWPQIADAARNNRRGSDWHPSRLISDADTGTAPSTATTATPRQSPRLNSVRPSTRSPNRGN